MLYIAELELSESIEVRVKYEFILGLKILLLKSILQTNTNQKIEQPNKQERKKTQNKPILELT